jgi:WD40 repeat protein
MRRSRFGRSGCLLVGIGLAACLASGIGYLSLRYRPLPPAFDRVYFGHKKNVFALAFTPDGRRFVTNGWDGRALLWDPEADCPLRVLGEGQTALHDFALSADGILFAVGDDPALYRWRLNPKASPLAPFSLAGPSKQIDRSPNGKWLAVSGADGIVTVRNADTGAVRYQVTATRGGHGAAAFSPDGRTLAVSEAHGVLLLDAATGKPRHRAAATEVHLLRFSPDGRMLAAGGYYSPLLLLDAATGQVRARQSVRFLSDAVYTADSRGLYTLEQTGILRRDGGTGETSACIAGPCRDPNLPRWMTRLMPFLGPPRKENLGPLALSPDGATLLYASDTVVKRIRLKP